MVDVVARLPGPWRRAATPRRESRSAAAARRRTSRPGWRTPGRAAALVGRVGDDAAGPRGRGGAARRAGWTPALAVDAERPTGTCIVLVAPGGERTMLPDARRQRRAGAGATCRRAARQPAATCTSPATRCCDAGRARRRWRRSRAPRARGHERLGGPVLGGAAGRPGVPATGGRARRCCCRTLDEAAALTGVGDPGPRRGARARFAGGGRHARRRGGAVDGRQR